MSALKTAIKQIMPSTLLNAIQRPRYARGVGRVNATSQLEFYTVSKLVEVGDHVIDLGANRGTFTKFLSDLVGETGRVFSFEALPETADLLQYIVNFNKLANVEVYAYGASDYDGTAYMDVPIDKGVRDDYKAHISSKGKEAIQIRRVDGVLTGSHVTFIKCDVEGHEFEALTGAFKILKRRMPALLVEMWGDPTKSSAYKLLTNLGYECYAYYADILEPYTANKQVSQDNYFFLTKAQAGRIKASV